MLARTPKTSVTSPHYSEKLKIRPRPAALIEAEAALDKALTELKSAQSIQASALAEFRNMLPGQIPTISAREVDEAGSTLREKYEAHQLATIVRDGCRADYEAAMRGQIDEGLDGLRDELADIADHMEQVLSCGVALYAEAASNRMSLHQRLPLLCREMQSGLVPQIRRNIQDKR